MNKSIKMRVVSTEKFLELSNLKRKSREIQKSFQDYLKLMENDPDNQTIEKLFNQQIAIFEDSKEKINDKIHEIYGKIEYEFNIHYQHWRESRCRYVLSTNLSKYF